MIETQELLVNLLLFVLLPIWGIAGFADWLCHRATRIETNSGLKESLLHSVMGIQIAIPILLCLFFYVNVAILLICIAVWILHELVAHWDVHYASPRRKISIWEMHAHSYLATLPLYMLLLIMVVNWPVTLKLLTLDWAGEFALQRIPEAHGGPTYAPLYLGFMGVFCVFPYVEENLRCLHAFLQQRKGEAS